MNLFNIYNNIILLLLYNIINLKLYNILYLRNTYSELQLTLSKNS